MTTTFYSTPKGHTAHTLDPDNHRLTYCARKALKSRGFHSQSRPARRPCKQCRVAAMKRFVYPYEADYTVDEGAVARSLTIDSRTIVEVDARVFTVEGSDRAMYVVVLANGLNPICNCMAGKTNPTRMCRHVARVLTVTNGLMNENGGVGVRRVS